jgi:hypothetical protein
MSFGHFSHSSLLHSAITIQLKVVEALQEQPKLIRAASAQKDANTILKALRNIISLCDIFQVNLPSYCHKPPIYIDYFLKIDTQLNIDTTVGKVFITVENVLEVLCSCDSHKHGWC